MSRFNSTHICALPEDVLDRVAKKDSPFEHLRQKSEAILKSKPDASVPFDPEHNGVYTAPAWGNIVVDGNNFSFNKVKGLLSVTMAVLLCVFVAFVLILDHCR